VAEISLPSRLRKIVTEVKQGMRKDMECKKEKCPEDIKTFYWGGGVLKCYKNSQFAVLSSCMYSATLRRPEMRRLKRRKSMTYVVAFFILL
jgi:hypothetical protein